MVVSGHLKKHISFNNSTLCVGIFHCKYDFSWSKFISSPWSRSCSPTSSRSLLLSVPPLPLQLLLGPLQVLEVKWVLYKPHLLKPGQQQNAFTGSRLLRGCHWLTRKVSLSGNKHFVMRHLFLLSNVNKGVLLYWGHGLSYSPVWNNHSVETIDSAPNGMEW